MQLKMSTQKLRIWRSSRECYVFRWAYGGGLLKLCHEKLHTLTVHFLHSYMNSSAKVTPHRTSLSIRCRVNDELRIRGGFHRLWHFSASSSLSSSSGLCTCVGEDFLFHVLHQICAECSSVVSTDGGEKGAKKRERVEFPRWADNNCLWHAIEILFTYSIFTFELENFFLLSTMSSASVFCFFFYSFLPSSCATTIDFDFRSRVLAASTDEWKVEMNMKIGGIFRENKNTRLMVKIGENTAREAITFSSRVD